MRDYMQSFKINEMAWYDQNSFEGSAILINLSELETIEILRKNLQPSSVRMECKRIFGNRAGHKNKKIWMSE